MRILVTGATGYVGRALVPSLLADGHTVAVAVRHPDGAAEGTEARVVADLAEPYDAAALLDGIEAVVHLAGLAHTGPYIADSAHDRFNRAATETLAKAAKQAGAQRFVFVSSIRAQSGPSAPGVLIEADPPRPTDAYGRAKLAAETAVRASGVPHTILRPVLICGPGVKGNLATLARLAAMPVPLPFRAIAGRRSLAALDNVVSAIRHVLARPDTQGETYIVSDPEPVTLPQMIEVMRRAARRQPGLFSMPPALLAAAARMAGRSDLWERIGGSLEASPEKLMATGWTPSVSTADALAAMVQATSARKSGTASRNTL